MSVEGFLDTNILLYAASSSPLEQDRTERALGLIEAGNFGISTQVLQEFFVNATRKAQVAMSPRIAMEWLQCLEGRPCAVVDKQLFHLGASLSQRYKLSYWDGAIIAAAVSLSARTLYTEDLSHGQTYGSVTVTNPFIGL
jgi:predicted nucleic acid-binding protein